MLREHLGPHRRLCACMHVCVCAITVYMFLPVYGPLELLAHNIAPQTGPPQGPSDSACVCVCLPYPAGSTRSIRAVKMGQLHKHLTHMVTRAHAHTQSNSQKCARKHYRRKSKLDIHARVSTHKTCCTRKNACSSSHHVPRLVSCTEHAHTHKHAHTYTHLKGSHMKASNAPQPAL